MAPETFRYELAQALAAGAAEPVPERRLAPARQVLLRAAATTIGVEIVPGLSLGGLVRTAVSAHASEARRALAVLLIDAIGVTGLLPTRSRQGEFARDLCAFLEAALLPPLRRAGYPFGGSTYDRLRFLEALHATIDEHLRPLEPSIPAWLHGLERYG